VVAVLAAIGYRSSHEARVSTPLDDLLQAAHGSSEAAYALRALVKGWCRDI